MPPLRTDRTSRACERCRQLKTRCYPATNKGACLRCETQGLNCSLQKSSKHNDGLPHVAVGNASDNIAPIPEVTRLNERLSSLESLVHKVVSRLDALTQETSASISSREPSLPQAQSPSPQNEQDAPMFLIRGIAEDAHVNRATKTDQLDTASDPIVTGIIAAADAYELLNLFQFHYGRWVNFDEEIDIDQLMIDVRTSPLLFNSICLVAARHHTKQRISNLAPTFFREAKRLLQASLLTTPQPLEFFQAALLLSLWSTTIGQEPLSIDSWLLTSYILQQGTASSMSASVKENPSNEVRLRSSCTWNHICIAHLQYCVGTGRKPFIQEAQITRCADVLDFDVAQFEVRMVAELKLYWIMVNHCCTSSINLSNVRAVLRNWRKEWAFLFDQPRSQFLEMGFNFAMLIAYCRSLHSQSSRLSRSKLNDMVQHARNIIKVAITHTDERTPHLTDHIYHIITFAAITICQLMTKYPDTLMEPNTVSSLHECITGLIDWLRSIGLSSHISRVLANIIALQFKKSTAPERPRPPQGTHTNIATANATFQLPPTNSAPDSALQADLDGMMANYSFQDLAWPTFFDFDAETFPWPQGSEVSVSNDTPTNESWITPGYAVSP